MSPAPPTPISRVRVVIVDFDGGPHTARCVQSLRASSWSGDLSVVVVDNGSRVPVADRLGADPGVVVIRSDSNLGFAGGANLGIGDLVDVDAVALLNNDAVVSPDWLAPLIATLDDDVSVAAASPKIRFAGRYHRLDITADGPVRLYAIDAPGAVRAAPDVAAPTGEGADEHRPVTGSATFWVANDGAESVRVCLAADRDTAVRIRFGNTEVAVTAGPERAWTDVVATGPLVTLVNNVGTGWRADGYGFDLGYLEMDDGRFDEPVDLDAWCGGAVLLRADHLREIGRFDARLFLYYEDLDLALRGRERGARFRLVPSSVVDHEHSATAVAGSPLAEYHKERNRLLILLRHRGWVAAIRAAVLFAFSTLGYLRRDVVVALLRRRRPSWTIVRYRLRALGGAIRRAPRFRPGSTGETAP